MRKDTQVRGLLGAETEPNVTSFWLMPTMLVVAVALACTGAFFFVATRGALIVRGLTAAGKHPAAHVYPIYSNMRLIRLVDFQPIIAAILLFQYDRLVSIITRGLRRQKLQGRKALITSCAFGNVMPRVTRAALRAGADEVQVVDIIENELLNAQRKMPEFAARMRYMRQDATSVKLPDASVDANVVFFLLHELPHDLKGVVLAEACRVLASGGKLYLAEFHRPHLRVLRTLSWVYFKVFEPLGLALWSTHDPLAALQAMPEIARVERRTVFFGNFQVIVATKA
jgi:ubiquinone/menaquinone biosynthesis C-methylase UbiE